MEKKTKRLHTIDTLRGITMTSMILYHFCWDLKYINGFQMDWYDSPAGYVWQQSICWCFILIAGFCFHLSKNPLKNGLLVFFCGIVVTCATLVVMPQSPVYFGILTMTGSSILILFAAEKVCAKKTGHPFILLFLSVLLFAVTKQINTGTLNLFITKLSLPEGWYTGASATSACRILCNYLGITQKGFFSSDYFSLIPWFFLFLAGYFLYDLLKPYLTHRYFDISVPFFSAFGKHSLIVYMLHQVVLYGLSEFVIGGIF